VIIQACLNGSRPKEFHPRLPISAEALAHDAAEAVRAGASEIHLHVRGVNGEESLAPEAVDMTLAAVRARAPGTLIGISTGAWIERDDDTRLEMIAGWRCLPDHASVNLGERDAPAVIEALHRRGIGIEVGLGTIADAERLVKLKLGGLALRILVEMDTQTSLDEAIAVADFVLDILRRAEIHKPILLHGFDTTVWPLVHRAVAAGYSTRVGLEDGCMLPDGNQAPSNAALVAAAIGIRNSFYDPA